MTDTGQVPGEGLPENAGMVEQPGVPAPAPYAYLSESSVEDEELLLPGAQGAWGNEVAPPAPEPVVETVHEPGPHETAGRDTGSVDLGGVRLPEPERAQAPGRAFTREPVAPRRPLHLGPPIPSATTGPVRSLADRGPADVPVRQVGPPTVGPEYLDVPRPRETAPQVAEAWGAAAPVGAGAAAQAETVAPSPLPVGAAQALVTRVSTEADGTAGAQVTPQDVVPATAQAPAAPAAEIPAVPKPPAPVAAAAAETWQGDAVASGTDTGSGQGAQAPGGAVGPEGAEGAVGAESAPAPTAAEANGSGAGPAADAVPPVAPEAGQGTGTVPAPAVDGQAAEAADAVATGADAAGQEAFTPVVAVVPEAPDQEPVSARTPESVTPDAGAADAAAPEAGTTTGDAAVPAATGEADTGAHEPHGPVADLADPHVAAPAATAVGDDEASASVPLAAADSVPVPGHISATETEQPVPAPAPAPGPAETGEALEPAAPAPATVPPPATAAEPLLGRTEAEPAAESPNSGHHPVVSQPQAPTAPFAPPVQEAWAPLSGSPAPSGAEAPTAEAAPPAGPGAAPDGTVLPEAQPEQTPGELTSVEGSVPATPHLAPTPPQTLTLPTEEQPAPGAATPVPAPRPADAADTDVVPTTPAQNEPALNEPALNEPAQNPDELDTQGAGVPDTAPPAGPTGPPAPGYDAAEREAVLKVMRERRDIRNGFRDDPIPHEVLLRVLEAAHTAPSVGHSQPWDFVVIRSAETRRGMHELATRQRDAYARSLPKGRAKQFKELKIEAILDTPVNIVVTADPTRGGRHTLGRHTQPQMAPYSSALAVENLWLAARAEGLGVGWVSFFDEREMVRALGLPEHLEVVAYLCVGYVDEFPDEPELMQAGWSKRRPLSWVVHEETYGRRALPGEDPHDLLAETVAQIRPLDAKALGEAWERQKRMTKPAGALGMLEIISAQLAGLSRQCPPPVPEPAAVAVFAGDHGVHAQGVTPWPQEVTAQMVANFLGGGAVCNAFATQVGAEVCVVDVGVASDLPATPGLLPRKVRAGTSDMTAGPAMTREEAKQAIEVGIETARDLVAAGNKALLTGEMGIANTTASAALISVFTGADPAEVTGRGTGINDETLVRKTEVVRRALELHQPDPADPLGVLAAVGGFEHAAMVGLLLGGASLRTPVILDGVSAGAAALVARAIAPEVLAACIAGHRSAEPGHVAALNKLGLRPLVDLDLRLGEGTGALLALPMVQSTARAMHEVATFDSAGVTEK
ncbi:nicotinate-nucleotide--dimethylbenzimidazole phosphoribosyltransferase [Streptomyces sp. M2CJ-2]|uniref:nicotinate-nucleotide--dimethylbenzimidazole phosphoribosyltransferase n=1 Tax=Streptomyces sp. M2CJ-2 TaxID=2803948 RepID=UPI0019205F0A|nr:nicotinate-nucleotide--dimethylbenzimidazole phosphoribosyltransferase [Streptomyces sp. M2CJ-2]MBL3665936.1 nicotinate-nucleotide--dimethylbenzimidazole phosphoribosyltransferase [Streptomyces sp. M2CJ-2]